MRIRRYLVLPSNVDISGRAKLRLSRTWSNVSPGARFGGSLALPVLKLALFFVAALIPMTVNLAHAQDDDTARRRAYLEQLLSVLPPERPEKGRVSPLDATWRDWLTRTGELPPDFDAMPSIPFLPDPLVIGEGTKNEPVRTRQQWEAQRTWLAEQVQHWITGTFPPPPENMQFHVLGERPDGDVTLRDVELRFGPDHRARMTVELIIPPGGDKKPVFMTQWNHRTWALVAVRRGYIGCVYAGADDKDDTDEYADIWYPDYDFTRLMRRAWGAHRVIDYLVTLPEVDADRIALTGHSRNGKQSLMAAAFDERIAAVIPSSGGTGSEDPYRYNGDKFDNETIVQITTNFPHWLHPRLRFFVGREHKLPVDQNSLMALVAPRALMLSSAVTEHQGNPWGIEQCYRSAESVYEFLGTEDHLAIRLRQGLHGTSARDIEAYVDFFDYAFGRTDRKPPRTVFYNYTFDRWKALSGESVDPRGYPERGLDDPLVAADGSRAASPADWDAHRDEVRGRIRWILGEEPPGATNPGPRVYANRSTRGDDYIGSYVTRPDETPRRGHAILGGYAGFGDYLWGHFYYPRGRDGKPAAERFPVVIYLHEYSYPTGFARNVESILDGLVERGFAVFTYDQLGFGSRIEEGTLFYERYPHWSKLGRMVADARAAVEAMRGFEMVDPDRVYVAGYALGATVGLYTAALDDRVAGAISVCGFTPMRLDGLDRGTEGLKAYSHLHGLAPRLGFFVDEERRVPCDYHEILAQIAPRPVLVLAPRWDRDAHYRDVAACVEQARKAYDLYDAGGRLELASPDDYNRFSSEMQEQAFDWAAENFR